ARLRPLPGGRAGGTRRPSAPPPLAIDHGAGVRVWDVDGREYLDFVAGIATSSLGHAHPAVVEAVCTQVARLAHASNLAIHEPGVRLAERLLELVGADGRGLFANTGAEANEGAPQLARIHGRHHRGGVRNGARPGRFPRPPP